MSSVLSILIQYIHASTYKINITSYKNYQQMYNVGQFKLIEDYMGNGSSSMSTSDMSSSGPLSPSVGSYASTFSGHADMRAPMASNPTDYSCYSNTISTTESHIRAEMKPREAGNRLADREITQDGSWSSYTPCDIYDRVIAPVFFGDELDPVSSTTQGYERYQPGDDKIDNEQHHDYDRTPNPYFDYANEKHTPPRESERQAMREADRAREAGRQAERQREWEKTHREEMECYVDGRGPLDKKHSVSDYFGRERDPNRDNMQRMGEISRAGEHLAEGGAAMKQGDFSAAAYHSMEAGREVAPIAEEAVFETADAYVYERIQAVEGGYSQNSEICHQ